MKPGFFKKEAMEQLTSPEKLDDYIRVSAPSIWILLGAMFVFLAGVFVWGIFGHLDTLATGTAVVRNGESICYVDAEDISSIKPGMKITINKEDGEITEISEKPQRLTAQDDTEILQAGEFTEGEWVYEVKVKNTDLPDGVYKAVITVERISPVKFVLN